MATSYTTRCAATAAARQSPQLSSVSSPAASAVGISEGGAAAGGESSGPRCEGWRHEKASSDCNSSVSMLRRDCQIASTLPSVTSAPAASVAAAAVPADPPVATPKRFWVGGGVDTASWARQRRSAAQSGLSSWLKRSRSRGSGTSGGGGDSPLANPPAPRHMPIQHKPRSCTLSASLTSPPGLAAATSPLAASAAANAGDHAASHMLCTASPPKVSAPLACETMAAHSPPAEGAARTASPERRARASCTNFSSECRCCASDTSAKVMRREALAQRGCANASAAAPPSSPPLASPSAAIARSACAHSARWRVAATASPSRSAFVASDQLRRASVSGAASSPRLMARRSAACSSPNTAAACSLSLPPCAGPPSPPPPLLPPSPPLPPPLPPSSSESSRRASKRAGGGADPVCDRVSA
mmetsp:Transcript_31726/g.96589  ORF Transcript_31726/g.96589 Transcript_31726/m.96589 type:complete len:416 (+) Transcript_31726:364-1611(+)